MKAGLSEWLSFFIGKDIWRLPGLEYFFGLLLYHFIHYFLFSRVAFLLDFVHFVFLHANHFKHAY